MSITILATLTISPSTLPNGAVGVPYVQTLTCNGIAPFVWSVSVGALPPGLILNTALGTITGIPTTEGIFNFTIHVVDVLGSTGDQAYD